MSDLSLSLWVVDDCFSHPTSLPNVTRNNSHAQINRQGIAEVQRDKILDYLRAHPQGLSNQEIEQQTGMRISSITARINELRKNGCVSCGGARINSLTGKLNAFWVVKA